MSCQTLALTADSCCVCCCWPIWIATSKPFRSLITHFHSTPAAQNDSSPPSSMSDCLPHQFPITLALTTQQHTPSTPGFHLQCRMHQSNPSAVAHSTVCRYHSDARIGHCCSILARDLRFSEDGLLGGPCQRSWGGSRNGFGWGTRRCFRWADGNLVRAAISLATMFHLLWSLLGVRSKYCSSDSSSLLSLSSQEALLWHKPVILGLSNTLTSPDVEDSRYSG